MTTSDLQMRCNNYLKGIYSFDCERDLDCMEYRNDNPDKTEALNEQGIMASNLEDDPDKAIALFRDAISIGNIHAMINGFTILWCAQRYADAIDWLREMNSRSNKNPKCLWNEAILLFFGKKIDNNPIPQSRTNAKSLLEQIVCQYFLYANDDYKRIIQDAYIFMLRHGLHKVGDNLLSAYEHWKSMTYEYTPNYSIIGNNFYNALQEYHFEPFDSGIIVEADVLNNKMSYFLDELYLQKDYRFGMEICDIQGLYGYNGRHKLPLHKVLRGTICKMSAWQAYLIYTSWKFLPLEDHDNYDACRPIFSFEDLTLPNFCSEMSDSDYSEIVSDLQSIKWKKDMIVPNVSSIKNNKHQFVVKCTWWNDWRGLFREIAMIDFNPKTNVPSIISTYSETLYPYICPVCI